jgi:alpha-amylase/alpha-mannosidase (GH57 family)
MKLMSQRYVCVHAHCYQPPRENPWLEAVELQDSAYPFHDWNERITAECYAPNGASRLLNPDRRIVRIVNNYSKISFNFGPTLLCWLEQNAWRVYAAILEADRISAERFSGHGSALAQVYNHVIMPLANGRDKRTQAGWGLWDFERRFGRKPEGMWLAEAAVDLETLEVLAEMGIKFTILAPHQAARVRPLGASDDDWRDVSGESIDPTMAYLQQLPSGREINLFFYDGPVSRAVAFEGLLSNGEQFAERLMGGFCNDRDRPQLMHIATDGETYGHHHRYGDMALAYALHHIEENDRAVITNYGEFLEKFPPQSEVQIHENTAWSCAHGIERWRSDCGCSSGREGCNQRWREPLRAAFDWLRDEIAPRFEQAAGELLQDPWEARNRYIALVPDRSPEAITTFLRTNARRRLNSEERVRALTLLEMQRHAMLMYTSCGWFFDELSGLETVQVMAYAARAIQLAEDVFGISLEEDFLARLEAAPSNLREHSNGREIYLKQVKTRAIQLADVGAHFAISSLFQGHAETAPTYCYSVARLDYHVTHAGRARLAVGQALVTSRITEASECVIFAVLHFGDNNLTAGVRDLCERSVYDQLVREGMATFHKFDLAGTVRLLDRYFPQMTYSLRSLFRDEQRRIVNTIIEGVLGEAEASLLHIYNQHAPLMHFLAYLNLPMPKVLEVSAEFVMNGRLRREFESGDPDLVTVQTLLAEAQSERVALDSAGLSYGLRRALDRSFDRLLQAPTDLGLLMRLTSVIEIVHALPFEVNLWKVQNVYYELLQNVYPAVAVAPPNQLPATAEATENLWSDEAAAWTSHFERLGELLGFAMQEAAPRPTLPERAAA